MKRILFSLLALVWLSVTSFAVCYTNTQTGLFSAGSTWIGGVAPSLSLDTWNIVPGTVVTYDVSNKATLGWGASTNNGTLNMTNAVACFMLQAGNLSGKGNWTIGSSAVPVNFVSGLPGVVIQFTNSAQCTMAGTNNVGWYGVASHITNTYLAVDAPISSTTITCSNVPAVCVAGDVLFLGNAGVAGQAGEYYVVASVSGTNITLMGTPFGSYTNDWPGIVFQTSTPGDRPVGSCVAFLSLPIVVKQSVANLNSTFGSQSNTLSGVRIQNLGNALVTSGNGWTLNSCDNIVDNYGFATASNGWNVNNCTIVNGSIATSTSGWTIKHCTADNRVGCAFGVNASSCIISDSVANNCAAGPFLASVACNSTLSNCTANYCLSGAFASGEIQNCLFQNCTANYCTNGIINGDATVQNGNNVISGFTLNNCGPLFINTMNAVCYGTPLDSSLSICPTFNGLPFVYDFKTWAYGASGVAINTNGVTTYNITNATIGSYYNLSARPNTALAVTVALNQTNNVAYGLSLGLGPLQIIPVSTVTVPGSTANTWTNIVLTYNNTSAATVPLALYISATGTGNVQGQSVTTIGGNRVVGVQ